MLKNNKFSQASQAGAGDLFQLLRDGTARTKAELISLTGLARATVTARIDQLVQIELLAPAGETSSTGGRPPTRYVFNEQAAIIAGVELGATHGTVVLTDLAAKPLAEMHTKQPISRGPESILDWVTEAISALLSDNNIPESRLAGIGIGVPGPVEFSTGRPSNPPIMPGWDHFDIPGYLQQKFQVPVLVDNDVNILALGEHASTWRDTSDLIFIKVATGIGAGIISGGALQRGGQGSAGDIGHISVPYSPDSPRAATDTRQLEEIASGTAIAALLTQSGVAAKNSNDVIELVRAGNPAAIAATRQAGRELGEVLAGVVSLLNPSVITVGGSIARAGEHLLAGVREIVYKRSIPLATQHLTIVQAHTGDLAGCVGAAIMLTQLLLSPEHVENRLATGASELQLSHE